MAPGVSDGKNEIEALRALNAQLTGRLQAVETLAVASLGLYLANSSNDPDFSKSRSLLDFIRNFSNAKANDLEPEAADAARHHADDLLSQVLENLRLLRGGS